MKTFIIFSSMVLTGLVHDQLLSAQNINQAVRTTVKTPIDSSNLQLTDFLALYKKNNVILNWTSVQQDQDDRFEVERSTDGVHFVKTGEVESAGNSDINTLYAFTDNVRSINTLKNDIYYRVKQVNKSGKSFYSKLLLVRVFATKALKVVSITPNPVLNNIKVNVELNDEAMVSMKVVNKDGGEILHKTEKGASGKNTFELEGTKSLKPGTYILEVIVNGYERMTLQLIKD